MMILWLILITQFEVLREIMIGEVISWLMFQDSLATSSGVTQPNIHTSGRPKAHQVPEKHINCMATGFPGKASPSKKAHQPNVIPKATARYGNTRPMYVLHSNASTPMMGDVIARVKFIATVVVT